MMLNYYYYYFYATNQTIILSVAPSSPLVEEGVAHRIWINSGVRQRPLSVPVVGEGLNYFRLAGDLSHVLSIVVLLLRLIEDDEKCNRNLNKDAGVIFGCFYNSLSRSLYNFLLNVQYNHEKFIYLGYCVYHIYG